MVEVVDEEEDAVGAVVEIVVVTPHLIIMKQSSSPDLQEDVAKEVSIDNKTIEMWSVTHVINRKLLLI